MRSPSARRSLPGIAPLAAAVILAAVPSRAADAPPVLLVVPAGSEMAKVEAARASVPRSRTMILVGAAERIPLKEGVELVADRSFGDAPTSDLVVVLAGEAPGEQEFLSARCKTTRVILFLGESPLVQRLKADGSRGALILVGGPEAVKALAGVETDVAPGAAATAHTETPGSVGHPTPGPTSTPRVSTPPESPVRRYFSARPTPTAVPATPGRER